MHSVDMQYLLLKQFPHLSDMAFPHTEPFDGYDRQRIPIKGRIYTIPTCSNFGLLFTNNNLSLAGFLLPAHT